MTDEAPRPLPEDVADLLIELVEKLGLLKRDIEQKQDGERYGARLARVDQKLSALAERLSREDPGLAKAVRTAWTLPARSLAFRNAAHRRPSGDDPE